MLKLTQLWKSSGEINVFQNGRPADFLNIVEGFGIIDAHWRPFSDKNFPYKKNLHKIENARGGITRCYNNTG